MKALTPILLAVLALLGGCADRPLRLAQPAGSLRDELTTQRAAPATAVAASAPAPAAARPAEVAVAQPVTPPVAPALPPEPRFDLVVNGAPARDVFLSLVTETRFSMLVHPAVSGALSVTLKGVTVREALEAIRDVYGFDFQVEGRRITVYPPSLQTRVYTLNVLNLLRSGRSEVRVSSGSAPYTSSGSPGSGTPSQPTATPQESSQLTTKSVSDFWSETTNALRTLVGDAAGRSVIVSPQA
ncbi:secretin N-terminal domain-containing protein, partial [Roseateles paludis]